MNKQEIQSPNAIRRDHRVICDLVPHKSRVLDLGCGNGELLSLLVKEKEVNGQGIEINEQAIHVCVSRGLNVSQQDIDCGLSEYQDKSFDYVIMNQSLQQVVKMEHVLKEAMRVGNNVIVGFPNFAYYKDRFQMFFKGRTPVTPALPYLWYDTPNLHFLSIADFIHYCRKNNFKIEKQVFLNGDKQVKTRPNLFAQVGIFVLSGME